MINKLYFDISLKEKGTEVFNSILKEKETIGYYNLPAQNISPILDYCETISSNIEYIVVIGIGGSSLGAKAVYEFLKPVTELKRKLYFFESTDPIDINCTLEKINLNKTHFLVISKSGTTVETISIYKYILNKHSNISSYTFITDLGSNLEKYAQSIEASIFYIPENVGGRFSVLSVVGLLPLALCGIDIKALLLGAKDIEKDFFEKGEMQRLLLKKALYYASNHEKYHINCIFAYSESLKYFCEWYIQLWGESLGKKQEHSAFNVGLTPIGLIGPKDQHSFLQLIMDGTRDKSITFVKIENFNEDICVIPDVMLPYLESSDTLNRLSFSKLITMQCESVLEALKKEEGIPLDSITLEKIDAKNMGSLIYYYELLTSLVGKLIDINTYNQPGVEAAKIILNKKLKNLTFK